ncbi:hypothetical protein INT43_005293 [Umbelopsis isabellina]|uniref:Carrier domain-containing protein n=1 Tax=Mortierella isabellina TaxID=91625 RepID=A0A8H7UBJ2_MORIS|nr:hypothetical protein INT43_005293 [Umbelopsis isabellina]
MPSATQTKHLAHLPFNIQCFIEGSDKSKLGTSLSLLLQSIGRKTVGVDPIDECLPIFMSLASLLIFRYTATSTLKLNVVYRDNIAEHSIQNLLIPLILSPNYTFKILLKMIQSKLECSMGGPTIRLRDVLHIQIHDLENESPEIVQMSRCGGLFLQFINVEGCFSTTFSFENLLSATYPLTIDIKSHWLYLLNSISKMTATKFAFGKISQVKILDEQEWNKLINVWGKNEHPNLVDSLGIAQPLLHNLFERQAQLHPYSVAIRHDDERHAKTYSYGKSNILANGVSNYLCARIKTSNYLKGSNLRNKDIFIGHLFPRCAESYIAMLGILKCGAAYVPLDPAYPMDRVSYILSDCKIDFIITTTDLGNKLKSFLSEQAANGERVSTNVVIWDDIHESLSSQPRLLTDHPLDPLPCHPGKPCYVIYTSGTTGKPKGCIIEHRSAVNLVLSESVLFPLSGKDIIFQNFSLAFDASVETIWMAFFNGATLYVPTEDMMHSGGQLASFINNAKITVMSCVPTMLKMITMGLSEEEMLDTDNLLPNVKLLIVGGEACPKDVIKKWTLNGKRRMVNTYGPTEATVIATSGDCHPDDATVTIGIVIPNYEVYILDPCLQPVPIGAVGELYIGGIGVARGYLNRDDLNAEKFILNPFTTSSGNSQRLYKSGDLVRYIPSPSGYQPGYPEGSIEHLGRIDLQVKIRGFRVEISEIETVIINTCNEVKNVVVNVWEDQDTSSNGEKVEILVAYLILKDGVRFDEKKAMFLLSQMLPHYMIPTMYQQIKEIPVLPSGKVNRKALPNPVNTTYDDDIPSPTNEFIIINDCLNKEQAKIAHLWSKFLPFGGQIINQDSDFFELGGHSMVAARLVSALRAIPKYKDVTMIDVYKYQKLKQFSDRLETLSNYTSGVSSTIADSDIKSIDMKELRPVPEGARNINPYVKWILCFFSLYLVFSYASLQLLIPYFMYCYVNIEDFTAVKASQNMSITISDVMLHPAADVNYDMVQDLEGATFDYRALSIMLISLFSTWMIYPILCVIAKWVILGRIKPGVYPVYGLYYWRWWVVHRMLAMLPLTFIKGSPLLVVFYRMLGAKIGKNVYIGTQHVSCLDMVTIGDNTSIGIDVSMHGYTVKVGKPDAEGRCHSWLIIGPIDIGSDCYIGAKTHLSIDTFIPNDTGVAEFSMVPENTVLNSGKCYAGSPISLCKAHVLGIDFANQLKNETEQYHSNVDPRRLPHWLVNIIHIGFMCCLILVFMTALLPSCIGMVMLINYPQFAYGITSIAADDGIARTTSVYYLMAMAIMLVISFIVLLCLEIAAIKWLLLGRSHATRKIYHADSWLYAKKWFVDCLLQLSLTMMHSLYATIFLPPWYRMLGAKIGRLCEMSNVSHCSPDRLTMKSGSFIADSAYLGPPRIHRGWVQLQDTIIGEKSFVGNSGFVPAGVEIKNSCLIGALSRPPLPTIEGPNKDESQSFSYSFCEKDEELVSSDITQVIPDGTSWLGSPGMYLPKRATASSDISTSYTFEPSWYLYLARMSVEVWRVVLPSLFFSISSFTLFYTTTYLNELSLVNELIFWLLFPFAYILSGVYCCLMVALLKYLIIWEYKPRESPLWSFYVWRAELIGGLEESLANPIFANHVRGTPFLPWWFRLLGAKIGRNVWMETTMITESDLLSIGDDCVIRADCTLQTHLFEDRVMKMSHLKIGNGCEIGACSVTLYDGIMEDHSSLGDFSLLMKGETLVTGSSMIGIPAQPVANHK